ncbi:VWA domain-containing protein [Alteromonas aestuariivivens]|uniref:VWA domain-containing protein n=1 Tax=Alteromonas aestuariivivens TaxID=1938339 RepID=A0A3D8M6F3_9ALTE|nr:VWA domain-containing protein [Alteromonas aestuariivivens]RDV25201.1 VWA domain-containing protein [Alteromonas aestuariivivens]
MHWQDFHFLRPEWFYALIPLLLALFIMVHWRKRHSGWQSVIANHLYSHMVTGKTARRHSPPYWLLAAGWLLAVTALAGPTWERLPQPVFQLKTGHVVVMDMSMSMRATDVKPDRLTRAKYKAIDLINQIDEGDMGLVAYAGDAFTISPLTADATNLTALLPSLRPEIMPVAGSEPLYGLELAAELLTNAGYTRGSIYWITDGIELSQLNELQDFVGDLPFTVNILGVGTAEGAPIKQLNGELLKQTNGAIVIPRMDEGPLKSLSRNAGGRYSSLSADERDIKYLVHTDLLDRTQADDEQTQERTGDQWDELGPYLLLVLLPFAAYGFRRGLVLCVASLLILPLASNTATAQQQPEASLNQATTPWWQKPFLNPDQQGIRAFDQQQYAEAANRFDSWAWKGAAEYKAGNYQAALDAYSQLDTPEGLYNQGNALAQLGELDAAIEKYSEVLEANPDFEDARINKELLEQLKQQQESESDNNQQQNDEQSSQDSQSDDSQSQQSNSENNQQNSDNQESSSEPSSEQSESESQQNDGSQSSQPEEQQENQQPQDQSGEDQQDSQPDGSRDESEQSEEASVQDAQMSDEEKENQRRLDNLMRRIPDDPAYLLQQKMKLEAQKRRRERMPANRSEW